MSKNETALAIAVLVVVGGVAYMLTRSARPSAASRDGAQTDAAPDRSLVGVRNALGALRDWIAPAPEPDSDEGWNARGERIVLEDGTILGVS